MTNEAPNQHWIYGLHAVLALLKKHPERIIRLCILKQREDNKIAALLKLANKSNIAIEWCHKATLDKLSLEGNHQGVMAYCHAKQSYTEQQLPDLLQTFADPLFILILDGVQDPHNLGACFRSAEAAGVHVIIAPKDKSVGLTPTVSKVASGTAEQVPFVQVTNLTRTLTMLKERGIWIYGAEASAPLSIYQANLLGPLALVLGAEGTGLRRLTKEHCDYLVSIPMKGTVNSLNVSVATGIFLFEAARQRLI